MTFKVRAADAVMCLSERGNVVVIELRRALRGSERPTQVLDLGLEFARAHPEGGGLLVIVHAGAGLPDATAVKIMSKTASALSSTFQRVAYVVHERGLAGAAIRASIRAVFAVVPSMQLRVFEDEASAVEWLSRGLDPRTDHAELHAAVVGVRRTYAEMVPQA